MTAGVTLQQEARALGDPTRHAIFRAILDAGGPVGVAELNEAFPLNHNAIRQHLAKLVDAGLLTVASAPSSGRGRPRRLYAVAPGAGGRWSGVDPYERLSRLLLELVRTGDGPEEVGRRASDTFGVPVPTGDGPTDLSGAMERQGFDPELVSLGDSTEIVLRACPFASAADADPAIVCGLHLGLAEGLVEGTGTEVVELLAHDPQRAGCRLRLRPTTPTARSPRLTVRDRSESATPGSGH